MKKTIKLFAFILATLMLVSFVPLAAFADEIETVAEDTETTQDASTEQTEPESEQEETSQYDNDGFSLPEDSENVHYERLPNGLIKVTVYPNVTESEENGDDSLSLPGHISVGGSLDGSSPMAFGPGADHTILDGGASATYPSDTYIASSNPTTNYGNATEALVTNNKILYIKYQLPDISECATIVDAFLKIAYVYDNPLESVDVNAHRVLEYWTESGLTWNVAQEMTRLGLEHKPVSMTTISDPTGESLTTPQFVNIDITEAAYAWISGTGENYGVALKTSSSLQIKFKTSEAASSYRPCFVYTFDIPEGTYFVKNSATEKFMDVEGPSTSDGAIIQQWGFSLANQKKWVFEAGDDGYYTIKSVYSGKYVGIDSTNTSVIRQYTSKSDYTKWFISKTASENYKFKCKVLEDTDLVLATQSHDSGNGSNLTLTAYIDDDNYRDEWTLLENIYFKDLTVILDKTAEPVILPAWADEYISPSSFTFSVSSETNCIDINSTSKQITTNAVGEAIVTATPNGAGPSYTFNVNVVDCPQFIKDLVENDYILDDDIKSTDDGFSMVTKSIADILMDAEIYYIDNNNSINVATMYDDWYLYSVIDDDEIDYGLIKMREQEDDYIYGVTDKDDAGVSVSFVSFAAETLFYCLNNPSISNKLNLEQAIDYTTYSCTDNHSFILSGYFSNSKYDGSYIIAREYAKKMASTAINGRIYIIDDTASQINSNSRLSDAIAKLNEEANSTLYNTSENYINIADTSNLTLLEMKAILTTHTANTSLYSFAAEITYHAQNADYWKPFLPLSHDIYWCAIRSDMWVGEDNESGFTDWYYYSEYSPYILLQDGFHNEEDYAN